jgi:hypothetical protein
MKNALILLSLVSMITLVIPPMLTSEDYVILWLGLILLGMTCTASYSFFRKLVTK